jgi:sugar phosphate isomerase/epimerase
MTSRRKFIAHALLGTAALTAPGMLTFGAEQKNKLKKIGFISNLLKNEFDAGEWRAVLKKAVEYGFTEYEGGVQGDDPKEFLNYCKEIGLTPIAGGITKTADMEVIKKELDLLNELEMNYAVSYYPWFRKAPFKLEDCKHSADWLNRVGELAKNSGLKFCWHNHEKEFWDMEEGKPFDYLMDHTDRSNVFCEMDIYWVKNGGSDPLEILKKYKGRIPLLHVKDMAPGPDQYFACPGSGIIDFAPIFAEAHRQGIAHYFVERDKIEDGYACMKTSGEYLLNLRF